MNERNKILTSTSANATRLTLCALPLSVAALLTFAWATDASARQKQSARTGASLYRQQCASCHGAKGEGTKAYRKPLLGNQSVGQLASYIAQNMPPGPRKCKAPDAKTIAAYMHEAFYSPVAQARSKPPRVELSRLTVRQYRNAVADLINSFQNVARWDTRRGLNGVYFKTRNIRRGERLLERIDPEIRFDFGTKPPAEGAFDPHQFSMRWEGSVLAPETGEYDFIVRTEHAARLWVNSEKQPLVDAWVKSGKDSEYRASLFLQGGQVYPIRLEFSKANQGVDDSDKLKDRPIGKAFLSLEWKPPKREAEVIPQRCLLPVAPPQAFVVTPPFPPDDRSIGYERGTSISKAWDEATTQGALEAAGYMVAHLPELSGVKEDAKDRATPLRDFCRKFVERAFRRPLTPELEQFYVERQFQNTPDVENAVKRVVVLTLKSPRFLYREIGSAAPDAYDIASRLSFTLWDSLPDAALFEAAAKGELTTREQVQQQAERMIADPRAWFKLREFLLQWLKVENYPDLHKDAKRYAEFDSKTQNDLRTSLELFLEQTVWNDASDFRNLLLTDKMPLNGRLAKIYGVKLPEDAPFQTVAADTPERVGVLTHPYLLASFAYVGTSSPIHRGVLLARNVLGRTLQPPPEAVAPVPADLHPNLTTRQRVAMQTKPAACNSCHSLINPLGYALERFDAIGRIREQENGRPVDSTGSYLDRSGKTVPFKGARDLAQFLADSPEVHAAFVEKLFQNLVKQPVRAYGTEALPNLQRAFVANSFSIRKQMAESAVVAALYRNNQPERPDRVKLSLDGKRKVR